MAVKAHVLLDLIELGAGDGGDGVLLTVDHALRERGVELVEGNGGSGGAEAVSQGEPDGGFLHADALALHIGRAGDLLLVGGEVTEAELAEGEVLEALSLEQGLKVGLEGVVQNVISDFLGGQQIGDGEDLRLGNPAGQGAVGGDDGHFQRAELDALSHLTLAAELRVGVDLNGNGAVGQLLDLLLEEGGGDGGLVLFVAGGAELDLVGRSGGVGVGALVVAGVGAAVAAAGSNGEDHGEGKQQSNQLFHFHLSSSVITWML